MLKFLFCSGEEFFDCNKKKRRKKHGLKTFDVKKVILNIFILNSMIVDIEVRGGRERESERGGGG